MLSTSDDGLKQVATFQQEPHMLGLVSRLVVAIALTAPLAMVSAAWSQQTKAASKKIDVAPQKENFRKSVFSGNEIRIAQLNNVLADCSSGPVPDVRVLTKPENGELRMEEIRYIVDRPPTNNRHVCNGKEVNANGVFYRSRPEFTGRDSALLEVDFKNGSIRQFFFDITVR
jgi:hypothetical protein